MIENAIMTKYYRTFDGMCWPVPGEALEESAWRAIHASPDKTDLLVMSSVVAAYAELIRLPQKQRNEIIRELRKGVSV